MADEAEKEEEKKTIVVIGDVTVDWLQEEIPRSQAGGARRHNYELYAGFRSTPVWGGAALVGRLLSAAIRSDPGLAGQFEFAGVGGLSENLIKDHAHKFLQSLAIVKESVKDKEKCKPVRVDSFRGFMAVPEKPAAGPKTPAAGDAKPDEIELYPKSVAPLACIVVDDAANGCRDDEDFVANLMKLAADAPLIVVKLSRPLDHNDLTTKLANLVSKPDRRIVIVVNADDLRDQGLDISRRLSWERSAADLILAAKTSDILGGLRHIGHVLVRFGNDGCVVLEQNKRPHLVFDPRRAEDTYNLDLDGTMPGATSAFTAAVTAALLRPEILREPDILLKAVPEALCASRRLLKRGFKRRNNNPSDPLEDYPLEVFAKNTDVTNDFQTIALPAIDEDAEKLKNELKDWSILSVELPDTAKSLELARSIVRDGHEEHLKDIPVAEFGNLRLIDRHEIEGYRSIENLLREYIKSRHGKKPRPLSVGVFGPPGSGKSFGIKEIAGCIKEAEIRILPFNLTRARDDFRC
jgi:hypothetical protein